MGCLSIILTWFTIVAIYPPTVISFLTTNETAGTIVLTNDRLSATFNKSTASVSALTLDGISLLGPGGYGPYLDCYCTPSGFWTPGASGTGKFQLYRGSDSTGSKYAGVSMSDEASAQGAPGLVLEQYWFLREGETGLHTFSRVKYDSKEKPFLRNLQELRTLFRPRTVGEGAPYTHLSTNADFYGPLPNLTGGVVVQDATWRIVDAGDPYVRDIADYFTKYTFQDTWRDHDVHGMFADGSMSGGAVFGAWLVMNTRDTYFGGPIHSDLVVDGIVYNYIVSNHHGDGAPNITDGFDRTFGPQYFHFNSGPVGTTLNQLRDDAVKYASPIWNADFYDSISKDVPNYVTQSGRGKFEARISLPREANRPIAILTQDGMDFQDNAQDAKAYQYWANIDRVSGSVSIPQVKAGGYRLTVYADGMFGNYVQDGVRISAGQTTSLHVEWRPESAGTELWRIGTPDKSSGEYRHGYARDTSRALHPEEYRIYWAVYDFPTEFSDGVVFHVGHDNPARTLNYVHWSVFGGKGNDRRPVPVWQNVNNWTIIFDVKESDLQGRSKATFTVQLAGAKTAAGNTDIYNASEPYSNLPYTVNVNGRDLEPWVIPYYQSSSCAVRSAVTCYQLAHKFKFDVELLRSGANKIVLSLPANATNYESAQLPESVYVQYDAMRLEVV